MLVAGFLKTIRALELVTIVNHNASTFYGQHVTMHVSVMTAKQ